MGEKFLLVPGAKNGYYYNVPASSIGLYDLGNGKVVLFDSGLNERTAKKIDHLLKKTNKTVVAIINTHHHADHCGGNAYFQKKYPSLAIYATEREKIFMQYPDMLPLYFCGGARPFEELSLPMLKPPSSQVTHEISPYKDQEIIIENVPFNIITLPGHTPNMIGVITPEKILYCGDALFGKETLQKYEVLFYTDIQNTFNSFKKLKTLSINGIVFYHGGFSNENISDIVARHVDRLKNTADDILGMIYDGANTIETLTQHVMQHYHIPSEILPYFLTKTIVQAYISYLEANTNCRLKITDDKECTICLRDFAFANHKEVNTERGLMR